jgi:hypothetical protein
MRVVGDIDGSLLRMVNLARDYHYTLGQPVVHNSVNNDSVFQINLSN